MDAGAAAGSPGRLRQGLHRPVAAASHRPAGARSRKAPGRARVVSPLGSDALAREGIAVRVLDMHTIKPLDRDAVLSLAEETRGIVTAEEHHLAGGLGGAIAEVLAVERPTRMRMIGMPDAFAKIGPTVPLRAKYGVSAEAIAAACRELLS